MVTAVGGIIGRSGDAQSCGTTRRADGGDCQAGDEGCRNKRADGGKRELRHILSHKSKVKVVAVPVKSSPVGGKNLHSSGFLSATWRANLTSMYM
jgi:hypothetical protein